MFLILKITLSAHRLANQDFFDKKGSILCERSLIWLGMKDLNPHKQSQSLSCCHYTNPQYFPIFCNGIIIAKTPAVVKYIFAKIIGLYTTRQKIFRESRLHITIFRSLALFMYLLFKKDKLYYR